ARFWDGATNPSGSCPARLLPKLQAGSGECQTPITAIMIRCWNSAISVLLSSSSLLPQRSTRLGVWSTATHVERCWCSRLRSSLSLIITLKVIGCAVSNFYGWFLSLLLPKLPGTGGPFRWKRPYSGRATDAGVLIPYEVRGLGWALGYCDDPPRKR